MRICAVSTADTPGRAGRKCPRAGRLLILSNGFRDRCLLFWPRIRLAVNARTGYNTCVPCTYREAEQWPSAG